MTEEELMTVKEVLEGSNENIEFIQLHIEEGAQYLIGTFKNRYFSFGMGMNDAGENEFFLQGYNFEFKNFAELTAVVTCYVGEKPAEFIESRDKEFNWYWQSKEEKMEFERYRVAMNLEENKYLN